MRNRPIITPGTTPARNIAPIETDINPPHTTIRILGGIITPIVAAHAVIATVNEVS